MKALRVGIVATGALALSAGLAGCNGNGYNGAEAGLDEPRGSVLPVALMNTKCPISDKDVDPEKTTEWNGKTVGFCCPMCEGKWDALSDEEKAQKLASAK